MREVDVVANRLPSTTRPGGIHRNVAFDAMLAVGAGVTIAVAGGLLPAIARQAGLAPLGIALLAASPYLANLLSALSGRYGPQGVRGFAGLRVAGALLLIAVAAAPDPQLIVLAMVMFWLAWSFGVPFQTRLWGAMYPAEIRGRVIGTLGMAKAAAAGAAALAVGALADALGAPVALAVAGLLGSCCALAALGLRSSAPLVSRTFSPREAVAALTADARLGRVVLAQAFFGGGQIAAAPLYALVYVDRLHLALADVGLVAVLAAAATTTSYLAWGAVADRRGYRAGLQGGALTGVVSLALYAIAPDVRVLWAAAVAAGLSAAAIDVGIQGSLATHTSLHDRAAAMAGWNGVTGARGVVMPLVATALVQARILDLTTALLACLVPAVVGLLLFLDRPLASSPATRLAGFARRLGAIHARLAASGRRLAATGARLATTGARLAPAAAQARLVVTRMRLRDTGRRAARRPGLFGLVRRHVSRRRPAADRIAH